MMTQQVSEVRPVPHVQTETIPASLTYEEEFAFSIKMLVSMTDVWIDVHLPVAPVYVSEEDGEECIIYKESDMIYGKPYVVKWMGEMIALVRTKDGVDILEPDPSEK